MPSDRSLSFALDSESDRYPAWWWLYAPLAAALFLSLTAIFAGNWYDRWMGGEEGLVELSHFLIMLGTCFLAIRMFFLPGARRNPWIRAWLLLAAIGSFYVAGEEVSWGQHLLKFSTPEAWMAFNDQGETNLHNTSSWLDQKPRTLLEIGVVLGGIVLPVARRIWPKLQEHRLAILFPADVCVPVALIAEIGRITERVGLEFGYQFRFFARSSEVQELFFYVFVLFYLIVLRDRLKKDRIAHA